MAQFKVPDRSALVRWRGTLEGLVLEGHPVRFVWQVLCSLDFSELEAQYPSVHGGPGRPPYHPRLIAALWIYGMTVGFETAAGIAEACKLRDDFKWLAGGLRPSDQTLLNFLTRGEEALPSVWAHLLQAMHEAGHVDLSVVFEDGTKLRANASPGSFRTLKEIGAVVEKLEKLLADRLQKIAEQDAGEADRKAKAEITGLRSRLRRAKRADKELRVRISTRRDMGQGASHSEGGRSPSRSSHAVRFKLKDFWRPPERDVLICPAEQELRLVGTYPTNNGSKSYRLYWRSDCTSCPLKEKCTGAKGRRIKVLDEVSVNDQAPTPPPVSEKGVPDTAGEAPTPSSRTPDQGKGNGGDNSKKKRGPVASLTDPEAVMMLATSEKRWEPSFNADITVTGDGIIVSQFLTKNPTDYHHFEPALQFVSSTLQPPGSWVGDGHYGTGHNLVLAAREGVNLYAARPGWRKDKSTASTEGLSQGKGGKAELSSPVSRRYRLGDFQAHAERDALVCPAGEELKFEGEYANSSGRGTYRAYVRSDCTACRFKEQCTQARGRRVKVLVHKEQVDGNGPGKHDLDQLLQAWKKEKKEKKRKPAGPSRDELVPVLREFEARMQEKGKELLKLRGQTVELTNAHLKQHGVGRFHVRGLERCGTVLTLSSMAHNLSKWRAKEAARTLKPIVADVA